MLLFLLALAAATRGRARRRDAEIRSRGPPGRSSWTGTSRTRVEGRDESGHLLRDQPGRQHPAQGQERRLPRLRRQVPLRGLRVLRPGPVEDPRALRRPRRRAELHRLRRHHPGHAQRPPDGAPAARQPARHPVRRDHRRHDRQRGQLPRLLLGLGGEDHEGGVGARDARALLLAALSERRQADLGNPALQELPAGLPLPDVLGEAPARRQLLHLPRQPPDRPREPAAGRSPRRRAVRHGEGGRGPARQTSAPRS